MVKGYMGFADQLKKVLWAKYAPIPLSQFREVASNDIAQEYDTVNIDVPLRELIASTGSAVQAITDTPLSDNKVEGVLGPDTTPTLDMVNGDPDSNLEVKWATSGQTAVMFKVGLDDIDTSSDLTVTLRGKMGGTTDTPNMAVDSYFNEGDTKVEDTSTNFGSSVANETVTIAAADIPSDARYLTCELTPGGTHSADTMHLYEVQVSYTAATENHRYGILGKSTTPKLEYVNGDTDSQNRLQWAAGNTDAIVAQLPVPDLDDSYAMTIYVRGKMGGTSDTPTIASDVYFDEGDTKVEDTSDALSDSVANASITVATADIPTDPSTVTIELTPGAHGNDTLDVYAAWVQYTPKVNLG